MSDKELISQRMRKVAPELDPLRIGAGWTVEDLSKPQIIIESTYGDSHPGSAGLGRLVEAARKGIAKEGGHGARYFTTDMCDGESQGTDGINYSLPSREIIADMIEIQANATPFDAGVFIASCDKGLPANLMALARINIPSVVVSGGTMNAGPELLTLEQLGMYSAKYERGEIDEAKLNWAKQNACPSCGACSFIGTASTMQIIAEALGTVPKGMLEKLAEKGILAYNIFYFEMDANGSKPLENYPYQAMTTLSTHDLPTVQGYWKGYDFDLGEQFGVYPSKKVLNILKQGRKEAKEKIRQAVENVQELANTDTNVSKEFTHQLQAYVADTNSALFGSQPEDWLNMLDPVNIPGTSMEYPNWRRKLSHTIEEIFANTEINQLLETIEKKRNK